MTNKSWENLYRTIFEWIDNMAGENWELGEGTGFLSADEMSSWFVLMGVKKLREFISNDLRVDRKCGSVNELRIRYTAL